MANGRQATYTVEDSDKVTVTISKGLLKSAMFEIDSSSGVGDQLQRLNLSGGTFDGANVVIKATKGASGDGLVDVDLLTLNFFKYHFTPIFSQAK